MEWLLIKSMTYLLCIMLSVMQVKGFAIGVCDVRKRYVIDKRKCDFGANETNLHLIYSFLLIVCYRNEISKKRKNTHEYIGR